MNNRWLGAGGYSLSFLLVAIPLSDTAATSWPPMVGEMIWRFGAVGLASRALMTPLLGLTLALVVAIAFDHGRVRKVMSVLSGATSLVLLVLCGLFALDALGMRGLVEAESVSSINMAAASGLLKLSAASATAALLAVGAWTFETPASRPSRRKNAGPAAGSIVGSSSVGKSS